MAIYNEILSARFARMAQKLFSMKGEPPIRALGGELTLVINAFSGVENRYLEGWERFAFLANVAAVAGNSGRLRIRNPAGSNVVAVVELLSFSNPTAADQTVLQNSITNVADLTVVSAAQLDARSRANSTTIASGGAPAADMAGARSLLVRQILTGVTIDFILFEDQELTILPGMTYDLKSSNVNQQILAAAVFRERPLEASELT